jgi:hypothetical protein
MIGIAVCVGVGEGGAPRGQGDIETWFVFNRGGGEEGGGGAGTQERGARGRWGECIVCHDCDGGGSSMECAYLAAREITVLSALNSWPLCRR